MVADDRSNPASWCVNAIGRPPLVVLADPCGDRRNELARHLTERGRSVIEAKTGPSAVRAASGGDCLAAVLYAGLPGLTIEVLVASISRTTPVIVVAEGLTTSEIIALLDRGADDVVEGPRSPREVDARIGAVTRGRRHPPCPTHIEISGLTVDRQRHSVKLHGENLSLTRLEYDLLVFLASSPDQVFSKEELLEHVWGSTHEWQLTSTVTEHIRRLRQKVEVDPLRPELIATVRGVGYRLVPLADRAFSDP